MVVHGGGRFQGSKVKGFTVVRTFINLQLQKLSEQARKDGRKNELAKSLEQYGNTVEKLFNKENSPLIGEIGTPLHIAVKESNKDVACFLLNSLKRHSEIVRKFLFASGKYTFREFYGKFKGTALHVACMTDDIEIVKALLDAAAKIFDGTLQNFLKCLNGRGDNALVVAAENSHNVQIFNELLSRANNKLDIILTRIGALCIPCLHEKEEFVDLLLQEFEHEKPSLKQLLLYNGIIGNALCYAVNTTVVEKLISAAKSMEDNDETLKNLLLPKEGGLPLTSAVSDCKIDVVEKLLNATKEIGDDNHTLKQLLLNARSGKPALHVATENDYGDILKLLLQTAAYLGLDVLEKLMTAVDEEDMNEYYSSK